MSIHWSHPDNEESLEAAMHFSFLCGQLEREFESNDHDFLYASEIRIAMVDILCCLMRLAGADAVRCCLSCNSNTCEAWCSATLPGDPPDGGLVPWEGLQAWIEAHAFESGKPWSLK